MMPFYLDAESTFHTGESKQCLVKLEGLTFKKPWGQDGGETK